MKRKTVSLFALLLGAILFLTPVAQAEGYRLEEAVTSSEETGSLPVPRTVCGRIIPPSPSGTMPGGD